MCYVEIHYDNIKEYQHSRDFLGAWLHSILPHKQTLVNVAFNEGVNNAFQHGKDSIHGRKVIVRMRVNKDKRLIIRVKDNGCGFQGNDKLAALECKQQTDQELWKESGRGLFIMSSVFDRVTYNNKGDELMLVKHIDPRRKHEGCVR